nr:hypothetical protein [Rhizobium sp. BK251]
MDELPPYAQRAWQPFQPDPVGHRHQPLRHPHHRIALVPLIADRADRSKTAPPAPFLIPAPRNGALQIGWNCVGGVISSPT